MRFSVDIRGVSEFEDSLAEAARKLADEGWRSERSYIEPARKYKKPRKPREKGRGLSTHTLGLQSGKGG